MSCRPCGRRFSSAASCCRGDCCCSCSQRRNRSFCLRGWRNPSSSRAPQPGSCSSLLTQTFVLLVVRDAGTDLSPYGRATQARRRVPPSAGTPPPHGHRRRESVRTAVVLHRWTSNSSDSRPEARSRSGCGRRRGRPPRAGRGRAARGSRRSRTAAMRPRPGRAGDRPAGSGSRTDKASRNGDRPRAAGGRGVP
jgi:hypothetical protein